jgi:acetyl esterase/lipase
MLQSLLETGLRQTMMRLVRPMLNPAIPVSVQRALIAQAYRSSTPPGGCRFETSSLAGVTTTSSVHNRSINGVVLYFHGGAYMIGSSRTHRGITGHLAKASGCQVVTPDYRLVPEHPFPAALDDAESVYRALLNQGFSSGQIALAGDSAGGGLAMALALRLKDKQAPLPSSLTLFSPWTDLTQQALHTPGCEPVLQPRWTAKAAKLYAGHEPLTNPLISPVFGDLSGLPPLLIQVGSQEILLNDAERLALAAKRDKVQTKLQIVNGLWHVFQVHASQLERASTAITAAGTHISNHLAD